MSNRGYTNGMDKIQITLRVSPELHDQLKKIAKAQKRSMNEQAAFILESYVLEHRGAKEFTQRLSELA